MALTYGSRKFTGNLLTDSTRGIRLFSFESQRSSYLKLLHDFFVYFSIFSAYTCLRLALFFSWQACIFCSIPVSHYLNHFSCVCLYNLIHSLCCFFFAVLRLISWFLLTYQSRVSRCVRNGRRSSVVWLCGWSRFWMGSKASSITTTLPPIARTVHVHRCLRMWNLLG